MSGFKMKIDNRMLTNKLKDLTKAKQAVGPQIFQYFKSITPIDTGNARSNTHSKGDDIIADYDYAEVLDKGRHMTSSGMRGSEQAPDGMSKPTKEYAKKVTLAWIRKNGAKK